MWALRIWPDRRDPPAPKGSWDHLGPLGQAAIWVQPDLWVHRAPPVMRGHKARKV